MIKLYLDMSDVIHTNKQTQWLTCKLSEVFVNTILFYDEKGSF